jgi:uncharacterized phage protein gp47/JayE
MSYGVTAEGFVRPTLDEILSERVAAFQAVHGADTYLDPDGSDMQQLGIEAEALSDLWQVAEDLYNALNPAGATGAALNQIGLLNGVEPTEGYNARVTVTCTLATDAPAIPLGSTVQDIVNGVKYTLDAAVSATGNVGATAIDKGTPKSLAGNVTKIVTPVYGWTAVTNAADGDTGVAAETQEQFRLRRYRSVGAPTQGITDGLRAALANITGVGRVHVFENTGNDWSDIKAGDGVLPPHSLAVLVENDMATVAVTIALRKSQGVTLVGDELEQVNDSNSDPQPIRYTVASDNPTALDVTITYEEIPGEGFGDTTGEAAVKTALADWVAANVEIGGTVVWSHLFAPALEAVLGRSGGAAIKIRTLTLGLHSGSMGTADIELPWKNYAALDEANITMTAV